MSIGSTFWWPFSSDRSAISARRQHQRLCLRGRQSETWLEPQPWLGEVSVSVMVYGG